MFTQISQITQNYNYAECLASRESRESHEERIAALAFVGDSAECVLAGWQAQANARAFCEIREIRVRKTCQKRERKRCLYRKKSYCISYPFRLFGREKYKVCAIKCKIYLSLRKIHLPLRHESYVREFYLMYNLKKCML